MAGNSRPYPYGRKYGHNQRSRLRCLPRTEACTLSNDRPGPIRRATPLPVQTRYQTSYVCWSPWAYHWLCSVAWFATSTAVAAECCSFATDNKPCCGYTLIVVMTTWNIRSQNSDGCDKQRSIAIDEIAKALWAVMPSAGACSAALAATSSALCWFYDTSSSAISVRVGWSDAGLPSRPPQRAVGWPWLPKVPMRSGA